MGLGAASRRRPARATAGHSMVAPSAAPTALAVPRMNRRRETATLRAARPRHNGEEVVWLAELQLERDSARLDGSLGFITKRDGPRPSGSCQASNEELPIETTSNVFTTEMNFPPAQQIRQLVPEMRRSGYDHTLRAGQSMYALIVFRSRRHGLRKGHPHISFHLAHRRRNRDRDQYALGTEQPSNNLPPRLLLRFRQQCISSPS